MNGANALIRSLVDANVDVCFTNPGTSEMHFVAALDDVPQMRGILGLFEGVVTGAADGYGRMADRPAATLLHLGPGLGNGFANLHNARRANTPIVNIVGDHATYHKQYDAPLESDIEAVAGACSGWVHRSSSADHVAADAWAAVRAANSAPGQVATLILPADVCWLESSIGPAGDPVPAMTEVDPSAVSELAAVLRRGEPAVLLLGGATLRERGQRAAARIAAATGAKVVLETFPARQERGAGLPSFDRLAYLAEFARAQLAGAAHLVLVDTAPPVSFFAYPDKASVLQPEGCEVHRLGDGSADVVRALEALADELGASVEAPTQPASRPERPDGALTVETAAAAIGAVLPEGVIVADEANTSGIFIPGFTAGAPRHDWLCLTGGAIGVGLPLATGAAVACPDRPVWCLEADGSALYTIQALWTQARESLDVTTVIFNNASYAVLNMELNRVGAAAAGPQARAMLDLSGPNMDFTAVSRGLGVPAVRVTTAEELCRELERATAEPGPHLVEAMVPPLGL